MFVKGDCMNSPTKRMPFSGPLCMAFNHGKPTRPAPFRFIEVEPKEISGSGVSFVSPQKPTEELLVEQLGAPEHAIFIQRRVTSVESGSDGRRVVECAFRRKL
jgi:hypothetical protein